jgi:hypothetical protein
MTEERPLHPERMLPVLLRHRVRFIILGGYGAMVHGVEGLEPTTDIDICPLLDDPNLVRLRAALDEMGAEPFFAETAKPTSLRDLLADRASLEQTKAVMLVTEWGALDLVIRPDGLGQGYRTLEPRAEILPAVDPSGKPIGINVPVASIHHIYISKKEAGRPKDVRALRHLAKAVMQRVRESYPGDVTAGMDGDEPPDIGTEQAQAVQEARRRRRTEPRRARPRTACGVWIESAGARCLLKPHHRGNHRSRT